MAEYSCKTRTNCFSVTDEKRFREIIESCGAADTIKIFNDGQEDGGMKYGFYCYGRIQGLPDTGAEGGTEIDSDGSEETEDVEYSFDAFCEALRQIIPDGEAIIITEVGSERIRLLIGNCTVITRKSFQNIGLKSEAVKLAGVMLENPDFTTEMDY